MFYSLIDCLDKSHIVVLLSCKCCLACHNTKSQSVQLYHHVLAEWLRVKLHARNARLLGEILRTNIIARDALNTSVFLSTQETYATQPLVCLAARKSATRGLELILFLTQETQPIAARDKSTNDKPVSRFRLLTYRACIACATNGGCVDRVHSVSC